MDISAPPHSAALSSTRRWPVACAPATGSVRDHRSRMIGRLPDCRSGCPDLHQVAIPIDGAPEALIEVEAGGPAKHPTGFVRRKELAGNFMRRLVANVGCQS